MTGKVIANIIVNESEHFISPRRQEDLSAQWPNQSLESPSPDMISMFLCNINIGYFSVCYYSKAVNLDTLRFQTNASESRRQKANQERSYLMQSAQLRKIHSVVATGYSGTLAVRYRERVPTLYPCSMTRDTCSGLSDSTALQQIHLCLSGFDTSWRHCNFVELQQHQQNTSRNRNCKEIRVKVQVLLTRQGGESVELRVKTKLITDSQQKQNSPVSLEDPGELRT